MMFIEYDSIIKAKDFNEVEVMYVTKKKVALVVRIII